MDKNKLYKLNDIIRMVVGGIFLLTLMLASSDILSIIFPILSVFLLGVYMFISALYFKRTLGGGGIEVGKKHYLYWAFLNLWGWTSVGMYLWNVKYGTDLSKIWIIFTIVIVLTLISIYIANKHKK